MTVDGVVFQGRKPRSKSRMLFEDEDVLFGGTPAEAPPVDLFAPGSPVSPTKVSLRCFHE